MKTTAEINRRLKWLDERLIEIEQEVDELESERDRLEGEEQKLLKMLTKSDEEIAAEEEAEKQAQNEYIRQRRYINAVYGYLSDRIADFWQRVSQQGQAS